MRRWLALETMNNANDKLRFRQTVFWIAVVVVGLAFAGSLLDSPTDDAQQAASEPNVQTASSPRRSVSDCWPAQFRSWYNQCTKILTYIHVQLPPETKATKLTLSYDGKRVRLSALKSKEHLAEFYTKTPPVFAKFGGRPFYGAPFFFKRYDPTAISVGEIEAELTWDGLPNWVASEADSRKLVQAFVEELSTDVAYGADNDSKTRYFKDSISLLGFAAALNDFEGSTPTRSNGQSTASPFDLITPNLAGNSFKVSRNDLRRKKNPFGEGYFVYVPKTRFNGTERLFIWFVNQGHAVKLNGATNNLTPDLPFPREAQYEMWAGSGLTHDNVTQVGLETVFSR